MLTIQILTKNNEKTIKKTLDSIKSINCDKVIIDRGSTDKTLEICSKFNNLTIHETSDLNLSTIRNKFSKEINFYIHPWETLVQGHEDIQNVMEASKVYVFENDVISKDLRIWTIEKFNNPIYETIINNNANLLTNIIISSKDQPNNLEEKIYILNKWKKEKPFNSDVYYYLSFCGLLSKDYKSFFKNCEEYYLREKSVSSSYIMMKYYCSQVNLHLANIKKSIEDALFCISFKPEMSEFWCLLGDIYYKQNQYKKSKEFYENAVIVGKKRKKDDNLPIEIKKYKEYPSKMIENIDLILKNINLY